MIGVVMPMLIAADEAAGPHVLGHREFGCQPDSDPGDQGIAHGAGAVDA